MKVSEAVESRQSIREYLEKPVDNNIIKEILEKSARAANGGNLQPWKIFVINGPSMNKFLIYRLIDYLW